MQANGCVSLCLVLNSIFIIEAEATSSGMAFHFPTTSIGKKFLRWLVRTRGRKSGVEFLCCIPGLGCGVSNESGTRESPWRMRLQRQIFCTSLLRARSGHPRLAFSSDGLVDHPLVTTRAARFWHLSRAWMWHF